MGVGVVYPTACTASKILSERPKDVKLIKTFVKYDTTMNCSGNPQAGEQTLDV
jgi:hypothetical protein